VAGCGWNSCATPFLTWRKSINGVFKRGPGWRKAQLCGLYSFRLHATQGEALRQPRVAPNGANRK
jgi:hypothetical protein